MKTFQVQRIIDVGSFYSFGEYQIDKDTLENIIVNHIREFNDGTETYNVNTQRDEKHNKIEIPHEWSIQKEDFDSLNF